MAFLKKRPKWSLLEADKSLGVSGEAEAENTSDWRLTERHTGPPF